MNSLSITATAEKPALTAHEVDWPALRSDEFSRLDATHHTYLDYTGAALYPESLVASHHTELARAVLGNPHSTNPASAESTRLMERARRGVLALFNADPRLYEVIFTANASAALRLVGESFPFGPGSRFVLTADNHNSVNGIRCFAGAAGAEIRYVPLDPTLTVADLTPWLSGAITSGPHLFAFPAQSNFSGVRHPLSWVAQAESLGHRVLLDAAAFVPTSKLCLSTVRPSFVSVSFYKMFGYPTGLGSLIVRRDARRILRRPWFAGGTVDWVSVDGAGHSLREGADAFEDGTPNFLGFGAILDGLRFLDGLGMDRIRARVESLTAELMGGLAALTRQGGRPLVEIYGPDGPEHRGGTVAFNVLEADGAAVPFDSVVSRAAAAGVSVRGGCFCNPGCAEAAFRIPAAAADRCRRELGAAFSPERLASCLERPVGALRASLGIPSLTRDIHRLLEVVGSYGAA